MEDDMTSPDEERYAELETLEAIFPEIQKIATGKIVSFSIDIPVHPLTPVNVTFPAAAAAADAVAAIDSHELANLPAVTVRVDLPEGYPSKEKPIFTITTDPPWLSPTTARSLESEGVRKWEELGHDLVAYDFIDYLQQAAESVFGMADDNAVLTIDSPAHKIAILDYDIKARKAAFDRETFECGVCLEPRKGNVCHQMLDCSHVFCKPCLQDFYNNAIKEGDLAVVRCLFPNCAKERSQAIAGTSSRRRKAKTFLTPTELLQMGLEKETVTRYVNLKYKNELESDKNTIYCPRPKCGGAARSDKRKKPEGFELGQADDDQDDEDEVAAADGDAEGTDKAKGKLFQMNDLLQVCEDCGYAFCSRCAQGWHGEYKICAPARDAKEITAEEQASLDYLARHTTPCPTCDAPVQKTQGCNHMICFRCNTHFCYLCSAWLEPSNPYQHFNTLPTGKVTSCYQRLWELEAGDGDDVDNGFAGGRVQAEIPDRPPVQAPAPPGPPAAAAAARPVHQAPDGLEFARMFADQFLRPAPVQPAVAAPRPLVDREGPLVLRLGIDPGEHPVIPPPVPQAPPPAAGEATEVVVAQGADEEVVEVEEDEAAAQAHKTVNIFPITHRWTPWPRSTSLTLTRKPGLENLSV